MPLAYEWLRQKFTTMRRNVLGSFLPVERKFQFNWAVIVAQVSKIETSDLMNLESKQVETRFFFIFPLTNHPKIDDCFDSDKQHPKFEV